jgi:hypothetical protein
MAKWTRAYVDRLPDSSFAYIEPGGRKDAEGMTEPRSKRHLPYKDADGTPDPTHVRNALARLPLVQAEGLDEEKRKQIHARLEGVLASLR